MQGKQAKLFGMKHQHTYQASHPCKRSVYYKVSGLSKRVDSEKKNLTKMSKNEPLLYIYAIFLKYDAWSSNGRTEYI
jgi:hypothetical protein